METLPVLLNASQARHTHLCSRQVLGVRIALAGLNLLNMDVTLKRPGNLLVISETDGCFVDGIEVAARVSVGHRSLKIADYGKIAATFIDLKTGQAVRLHPDRGARELAQKYYPDETRAYFAQLKAYQTIPDSELLNMEWVTLDLNLQQVMGSPNQRAYCSKCGEEILNGREMVKGETALCVACAGYAYYYREQDSQIAETNLEQIKVNNTSLV